jgi:hypothetical protein
VKGTLLGVLLMMASSVPMDVQTCRVPCDGNFNHHQNAFRECFNQEIASVQRQRHDSTNQLGLSSMQYLTPAKPQRGQALQTKAPPHSSTGSAAEATSITESTCTWSLHVPNNVVNAPHSRPLLCIHSIS